MKLVRGGYLSISIVLILLAFLLLGSCAKVEDTTKTPAISTLDKVEKEGVINVGYVIFPPTVIKDPKTGELSGHFIDAIEYIAKEIDAKIKYHEATWATFVAGLQAGQYDVAVAGTYKTISRAKSVAFTLPLFYLGNSALVKAGENRFTTVEDFDKPGIKLAVTQGTGEHDFAKTHFKNAELIVQPSADLTLPLLEVVAGRAAAAFSDTFTITEFLKQHPNLKGLFIENPFNLTPVAWTVRPDDTKWLNFLNTSVEYLEASGRLADFEKKYDANWLHKKVLWESK